MKILVAVKRTLDANARIRVKADGSGIDTANVRTAMNPFDEIAVEEAVRLRERGEAAEIVAVTIGPAASEDTLRTALAMGADRAIHIETDAALEPLAVAKLLRKIVETEQPGLVLLGKQAIDDDASQTGPMLAALLGWPQATFASKLDLSAGRLRVTREIDSGLETLDLPLPAIVTADLRLNTPRYASLPNIMKARKKPVEHHAAASFGLDLAPRLESLGLAEPPPRPPGKRVGAVAELVAELLKAGAIR